MRLEERDDGRVAFAFRVRHRRVTVLVLDVEVGISPICQQQPDDVYVPGAHLVTQRHGYAHHGIYAGNGMMYDAGNPRVDTSYRSIDWMIDGGAKFIRVL